MALEMTTYNYCGLLFGVNQLVPRFWVLTLKVSQVDYCVNCVFDCYDFSADLLDVLIAHHKMRG